MKGSITALLPCRAGSTRIKNKNTRSFAGSSLLEIKLNQLLELEQIDRIILSTNDPVVIELWEKKYKSKLELHIRPDEFASDTCDTHTLVQHFIQSLDFEHLLWTHTTSPFLGVESYQKIISKYWEVLNQGFDSLLTAQRCQEFCFTEDGKALNYDVSKMGKWPRTQLLKPFYIVNSAVFLCSKKVMQVCKDRLGQRPFFYPSNQMEGIDLDWPEDFNFAENLWKVLQKRSKSPSEELCSF